MFQGWNDVGFHGSDQYPTPNIDALAYNGVILNKHYVQQTCSPSRSALMTGRYPIHTSMQGFPILAAEPNGLPLDYKILPEYLQELGYRTHAVGKWHLGFFRTNYTPLQRGFETHLGYYTGYTGYYDYMAQVRNGDQIVTGLDARRNGTVAWDIVGKYSTEVWSQEAVRVIKNHNPEEPLFLYFAHNAVHASNRGRLLEAPQGRVNSFKYIVDPNRRTFAAMVSKVDDTIGDLVEALKEKEMLDNTIILFFSDNGAPTTNADFPNWGSNWPFRGAKETLWEGGVRSPSFIWSAALQENPRVSNSFIHITDWLPTLYSAAGGDRLFLPKDIDGVDQWRTIFWDLASPRDQALLNINERERSAGIISRLDTPFPTYWKLIVGTFANGRFDGVYNDVRSPANPPYDYKKILNSRAYKAINTYSIPATKELSMKYLRGQATVGCGNVRQVNDLVPDCRSHPCLFNLDRDPCERLDLAPNNTDIVQKMYNTLKVYRLGLLAQSNQPLDLPAANPINFNNTWSSWRV
nr:arylsulfatase B [Halyomorpha halys]